jgi:hydrogenase maturation protease
MSPSILVAGVGNASFGDDGFGVAVARRLRELELPPNVQVEDFGARSMHLAFELAAGWQRLVLIDTAARGGAPGTLYVIDPLARPRGRFSHANPDALRLDLEAVFGLAMELGARLPETRLIGCEPGMLDGVSLSTPVQAAIAPAIEMVRTLLVRSLDAWMRGLSAADGERRERP